MLNTLISFAAGIGAAWAYPRYIKPWLVAKAEKFLASFGE